MHHLTTTCGAMTFEIANNLFCFHLFLERRIARRLGQTREMIRDHLSKMAELPNPPNANLSRGFTVSQVTEKHNWTEPMVWSQAGTHPRAIDRPHPLLFLKSEGPDP